MNERFRSQPFRIKPFYMVLILVFVLTFLALFLVPKLSQAPIDRDRNESLAKFKKELSQTEQKIKDDTYGGQTPQATLDLFVDALEQGDTDLSSKYFVIDKQASMKEYYDKLKADNQWDLMMEDIKKLRSSELIWDKISDNLYYLSVETVGGDGASSKDVVFTFIRQASILDQKTRPIINPLWKID